jgi:dTMP kinase
MADADPNHYLVLDARDAVVTISAAVRDRVLPLLGRAGRTSR